MLRDDINNAVKDAMRAKDERKLSTLRMVNSTIKNADIEARGQGKPPLSDAELLSVLQKMIKQRQEAVELYDKGGRAELAAQEREEIAIITGYLPKQMSEADVKAAISATIAETGAAGIKDMGKVIGALKTKYAGQMEIGNLVTIAKRYRVRKHHHRLRRIGSDAIIRIVQLRRVRGRKVSDADAQSLRHFGRVVSLEFFAGVCRTGKDRDATDLRQNFA